MTLNEYCSIRIKIYLIIRIYWKTEFVDGENIDNLSKGQAFAGFVTSHFVLSANIYLIIKICLSQVIALYDNPIVQKIPDLRLSIELRALAAKNVTNS